jgi:GT2 family glycosyltransferase
MKRSVKSQRTENRLPFVSILISNWNGAEVTDRCISSLFNFTDYPNSKFNIVVVDDGSTDNSVEFLRQRYLKRRDLIALENNVGFIMGNNAGIKYIIEEYDPHYILLLNNDTQAMQKDWLKKLVETAERDEKIGMVGLKLMFPNGRIQWSGRRKEPNLIFLIFQTISAGFNPGVGKNQKEAECADFVGEANTVSGACMLVKTELFKKIGLLDERLAPMFGEDVEYSFRAWESGYKVIYRGDVDVVHHESYTIEKFKKELQNKKTYWALRNGMIIAGTYFGFWKTLVFGLPIFTLAALLDKKDKSAGLKIRNMKFREGAVKNISILFKAMHDGLLCRKHVSATEPEKPCV